MSIEADIKINRGGFQLHAQLKVPMRGITAIYGKSGSGKTSILRALAGLDRYPKSFLKVGDVIWQEGDFTLPVHQRAIGYVFQEASLFPHLNVQANIEYGYKRIEPRRQTLKIEHITHLLNLHDLLSRSPHNLSGGERQRVAIARALATNPDLLLMDEPLSSLDNASKQEIIPYLDTLHEELGIPVIYVSHDTDELARLADFLILIEDGLTSETQKIAEMLTRLDMPLAQDKNAEALIEATVESNDNEYNLTQLRFSGGIFHVKGSKAPISSKVRLRIAARDVSVSLSKHDDTSILNIFPARVTQILQIDLSHIIVQLRTGDDLILARLTRKSAENLRIKIGVSVFIQIKSVALFM